MPRIDRKYLDCAIYLYRSVKAADQGQHYGGSGFLVAIPFEQKINGIQRSHVYAVTNSHVIREAKSTVIRLNTIEGKTQTLPYKYEHWVDDWNEDDLALCMLDDTIMSNFRALMLLPNFFITENNVKSGYVDIGSDIAVVGRFIAHDGTQVNLPAVRFGNVSMLNSQPIQHEDRPDLMQESFLVECRTISGTSGSPVFLTGTAFDDYSIVKGLLGIVWGYMWYKGTGSLKSGQPNVHLNTGMMNVVPAWKLANFLTRDDLVRERKNIEDRAESLGE